VKEQIYTILYLDENNELVTTLGKDLKVGSVEISWYDINKKLRFFIHKNRYILRKEVVL